MDESRTSGNANTTIEYDTMTRGWFACQNWAVAPTYPQLHSACHLSERNSRGAPPQKSPQANKRYLCIACPRCVEVRVDYPLVILWTGQRAATILGWWHITCCVCHGTWDPWMEPPTLVRATQNNGLWVVWITYFLWQTKRCRLCPHPPELHSLSTIGRHFRLVIWLPFCANLDGKWGTRSG